jgi:hypothetical protein
VNTIDEQTIVETAAKSGLHTGTSKALAGCRRSGAANAIYTRPYYSGPKVLQFRYISQRCAWDNRLPDRL